jgi:hypothetical protein
VAILKLTREIVLLETKESLEKRVLKRNPVRETEPAQKMYQEGGLE